MATMAPPRPAQIMEPDPQKLEDFMHKIVGDMAAAMSGSLVVTGMKLGEVSVTVRAGYSHYESDTETRDSPYVAASASLQY